MHAERQPSVAAPSRSLCNMLAEAVDLHAGCTILYAACSMVL